MRGHGARVLGMASLRTCRGLGTPCRGERSQLAGVMSFISRVPGPVPGSYVLLGFVCLFLFCTGEQVNSCWAVPLSAVAFLPSRWADWSRPLCVPVRTLFIAVFSLSPCLLMVPTVSFEQRERGGTSNPLDFGGRSRFSVRFRWPQPCPLFMLCVWLHCATVSEWL